MKIFFSGIGGSGVSALACFAQDRGHTVSGSDRAFDTNPDHPVLKMLLKKGIRIVPQDGSGMDSTINLAVFSTAVEAHTPEMITAKELGIPINTRPQYLAGLVEKFDTIAVAGTSGKSTTSGLLAFLMQRLGLAPNFIGGGRVKNFRTENNPGNYLAGSPLPGGDKGVGSRWLVIEACESDGTIIDYKPLHSVFLNLALDHHRVEKTGGLFETLARNTTGLLFVNPDDENLIKLNFKKPVTFGIKRDCDYRAADISFHPFYTDFSLEGEPMRLNAPGRHNLYDALSAIAVLSELGSPMREIARFLPEFGGIERRFDIHLNNGRGFVIDDYAHNPHKIAALMEAARKLAPSIAYIFQPHGYAPTRMMRDEYIEAFAEGLREDDELILLPIFYAGGTVSRGISSEDIAEGVRANGKRAQVKTRGEVLKKLNGTDKVKGYFVLGARDETLSDFAGEMADRLKVLNGKLIL